MKQGSWAVAAGFSARGDQGRKVRTPQGSVPDNVRDAGFKARGRPVPQRRYRLGYLDFRKRVQHPEESLLFSRRGKGEKVR